MAFIMLTLPTVSHAAEQVTIKMATLAPQGSEWHQVLQEMGASWERASRGQSHSACIRAGSPATMPTWFAKCASAH